MKIPPSRPPFTASKEKEQEIQQTQPGMNQAHIPGKSHPIYQRGATADRVLSRTKNSGIQKRTPRSAISTATTLRLQSANATPDVDALSDLLGASAKVTSPLYNIEASLVKLIERGQIDHVRSMLRENPDIPRERSLNIAADRNAPEIVRELVGNSPSRINAKGTLSRAVITGKKEVVAALLSASNLELDLPYANRLAIRENQPEIAKLIDQKIRKQEEEHAFLDSVNKMNLDEQ